MITPTIWIERRTLQGSDVHGQPILSAMTREKVCPVKLHFDAQHTTVRTDSGASHGHASEETANIVILALPNTKIVVDDVLTIQGHRVRVNRTHSRYTVTGALDHLQVHCVMWK